MKGAGWFLPHDFSFSITKNVYSSQSECKSYRKLKFLYFSTMLDNSLEMMFVYKNRLGQQQMIMNFQIQHHEAFLIIKMLIEGTS